MGRNVPDAYLIGLEATIRQPHSVARQAVLGEVREVCLVYLETLDEVFSNVRNDEDIDQCDEGYHYQFSKCVCIT